MIQKKKRKLTEVQKTAASAVEMLFTFRIVSGDQGSLLMEAEKYSCANQPAAGSQL